MSDFKLIMENWRAFKDPIERAAKQRILENKQLRLLARITDDQLPAGLDRMAAVASPKEKLSILQTWLYRKGYFDGVADKLGKPKLGTIKMRQTGAGKMESVGDGIPGEETIEAIKNLQRDMGFLERDDPERLPTDGVVDGIFGSDTAGQMQTHAIITDDDTASVPTDLQKAETHQADNVSKSRSQGIDAGHRVMNAAKEKFIITIFNNVYRRGKEPVEDTFLTADQYEEMLPRDKKEWDSLKTLDGAKKYLGPGNDVVKMLDKAMAAHGDMFSQREEDRLNRTDPSRAPLQTSPTPGSSLGQEIDFAKQQARGLEAVDAAKTGRTPIDPDHPHAEILRMLQDEGYDGIDSDLEDLGIDDLK